MRRTTKAAGKATVAQTATETLPPEALLALANKQLAEGMAKLQQEIAERYGCRITVSVNPQLICEVIR